MGIVKGHEILRLKGVQKLTIVIFLASLAMTYVNTIWAVYLDSFFHNVVSVGIFSAILSLIAFLFFFLFIPLIEKSDKAKLFSFSLLLFMLTYFLFAVTTKFYIFIILAIIMTIVSALRITTFGILVKEKSDSRNLSKNEGIVYTFRNLAWVLGPLIAGFIASRFGIKYVFILSTLFTFLAFISFRVSDIKDKTIGKKSHDGLIRNFKAFFRNKDRIYAYILGGGVNLWWVLIYLFVPLLMIRNNFNNLWVGFFLFAVAIPLISLEYSFAKLSGKIGFKKIFKIGFLIPCIFSLLAFFTTNIYLILIYLIIASIGLAMLEPTTEAYFFDILDEKQTLRFYGPYNTTIVAGQIIGKLIPSIALIFFPFRYIFLIYSIFMLIMVYFSFKIKDVVENKR